MPRSAGILIYRKKGEEIEFLLLKPGGPFYKNADAGVWAIPKGEIQADESELEAARREMLEETGFTMETPLNYLGEFKLRKGKQLLVYITESNFDLTVLKSKEFEMEYPKNSGERRRFLEIEKGEWMTRELAESKCMPKQLQVLDLAIEKLNERESKG